MTKDEELREVYCPHCNQGAEIERLRELLRAGINLMRPVAEYEDELAWLRDADVLEPPPLDETGRG